MSFCRVSGCGEEEKWCGEENKWCREENKWCGEEELYFGATDVSLAMIDIDASKGFIDLWVHLSFAIFAIFDLKRQLII